jgi:hypothetical protein
MVQHNMPEDLNHLHIYYFLQAWCKFYENARSFILVPPTVVNTGCLSSVHLCEAPGAFITSLNHFLKLHNPGIEVCIQTHHDSFLNATGCILNRQLGTKYLLEYEDPSLLQAVPRLMQLVASLSLLGPRLVHVRFVVDEVVQGQVFL